MTQEETIKQLESLYDYCENMRSGDNDFAVWERDCEAIDLAISAIRPVTREQVERVWRGCEYCAGDVNDRPYLDSKEIYIYDDGILMNGYESACKILFCPKCGRPLTDEAVDMVMERMEALHGKEEIGRTDPGREGSVGGAYMDSNRTY